MTTTTAADSTTSADTTGADDASSGTTDSTDSTGTTGTTGTTTSEGDASSGSSSSTGAVCDMVECDGECIDPETNPDYCGATMDCAGANAGVICPPSASCVAAACVDSCDNCSFETADFTGWTVQDLMNPFFGATVLANGTDPSMYFGVATATDGGFVAVHGFDGDGASSPSPTISIGQDIDLRMGVSADLVFDYRAAWDLLNEAPSMLDRTFEVHIEPAGGGMPMETILVETAMAMTVGDTGLSSTTIDLSAYEGQTIFIDFVWTVPEDFSGPAQAELDDVRIEAQ